MRKLAFLLMICTAAARGGFERGDGGARLAGLGGVVAGVRAGAWSALGNPAGLASLGAAQAGFSASPAPFGLSELAERSAVAAFALPGVVAGLSARSTGSTLYTELELGCSLAWRFRGAAFGVSVERWSATIQGYGSAATTALHAGALVPIADGVEAGFLARALNAPQIGAAREPLPLMIALGLSYTPAPLVLLVAELEKEGRREPTLRAGAEAGLGDGIVLIRGGLADRPATLHAGAGVRVGPVRLDYAYIHHAVLGATHVWSVTCRWGEDRP